MLEVSLNDFVSPFFHLCPERFAPEIVLHESSEKTVGKVEDNCPRYQIDQGVGNRFQQEEGLFDNQKRNYRSDTSQDNSE